MSASQYRFSKKYFNLSQQRAEILFNAERLLSESARGVLKERPAGDDDWVEVPTNEEPLQQETFTVNLGNQLKITQNLRYRGESYKVQGGGIYKVQEGGVSKVHGPENFSEKGVQR